jgi:hypothetical protein
MSASSFCTGVLIMEIKELLQAARHIRPWVLLIFTVIAFQSLKNASPPDVVASQEQGPMTMLVAQR